MGHYSDSYEATRRTEELKRRENLMRWIADSFDDLDTRTLEYMYFIAEHQDEVRGFAGIIERVISKASRH